MTEEFTYPSLKCVLEYLEANKKFHITARSPQLQKFEKSVPLRLIKFSFEDWKICINDYTFLFTIQKRQIEPASVGASHPIITPIVSIPMKEPTSEFVTYGVRKRSDNSFYIRMRVIEAGLSTPVEQPGGFLSWFQSKKTK
ncbi:unnamed protein product [Caenorhabditis brenneri]